VFLVHVGENVNVSRGQFFSFAQQFGRAAVIEFASIPDARAGENADAYEARCGRESDGQAHHAAIVNHVDADGHRRIFNDFGRGDGVRGHRFGLHVVADVVRQVPHIFDHQAVYAAVEERFGVAQRVINDRLDAVAVVTGRSRQRPQVDHADHRLGRGKKIRKRFHSLAVHFFFPFRIWSVVGHWRHL
jgi:hypothetical protein